MYKFCNCSTMFYSSPWFVPKCIYIFVCKAMHLSIRYYVEFEYSMSMYKFMCSLSTYTYSTVDYVYLRMYVFVCVYVYMGDYVSLFVYR